jgi:hypothetical protein
MAGFVEKLGCCSSISEMTTAVVRRGSTQMTGFRHVEQGALFNEFSSTPHVPAGHLLRPIDRFVDLRACHGSNHLLTELSRHEADGGRKHEGSCFHFPSLARRRQRLLLLTDAAEGGPGWTDAQLDAVRLGSR